MNIERIMAEQRARVSLITRKVALEALRRVVQKSPVDTGRFRGNWNVAVGAPNTAATAALDPSGGQVLASGTAQIGSATGLAPIFVTNSLPYAQKLEEGSSQQAPAGIVSVTAAEIRTAFRTLVR
jgi:hypothetical protein